MKNIKFNDIKHIYFCGIGGISMSGLARVLFEKDFEVSGSDTKANNRTKDLEDRGVKIFVGQKSENISDDIDLFVYTAAIHNDNPEFIAAKEKNIKMMTRAELLGYVMSKFKESIAISGTHGKTTTTSMLSYILLDTKLDPTISVGGIVKKIKGNIYIGKGDTFVTEACEYTNSFLELYPTVGVILNIEEDHLDFFKDLDEIRDSFKNFAKNTSPDGCIIINNKIENNREITQGFEGNVVRYGTENSDCYATNIRYDALGYPTFDLVHKEETYENVKLYVGGNHNIYNALAAICVAFELGVSIEDIRKGLSEFKGVDRRFEVKGKLDGITIVDDYAHHPSEISATLNIAKRYPHDRLVVVFQPHTYTRTKAFFDDFANVLKNVDEVIIAKIYPARETDNLGMSSNLLSKRINELGGNSTSFETFDEIENYLLEDLRKGDLLITMGAGDILRVGEFLLGK